MEAFLHRKLRLLGDQRHFPMNPMLREERYGKGFRLRRTGCPWPIANSGDMSGRLVLI